MAIIPGVKNFDVVKRADFPLRLTIKDGNGNPVSLNGYTVAAQVWDSNRRVKFADWSVVYTSRGTGVVDIKLDDTDTTNKARVERVTTTPDPTSADADDDFGFTTNIEFFEDSKKYNPETDTDV